MFCSPCWTAYTVSPTFDCRYSGGVGGVPDSSGSELLVTQTPTPSRWLLGLGSYDGAHRNSPLVLTEIPQVSQPVACLIQPRWVGVTPFRSASTQARWARMR